MPQYYTLQTGDNPSSLAGRFLGDQRAYEYLMAANPGATWRSGSRIVIPQRLFEDPQPGQYFVSNQSAGYFGMQMSGETAEAYAARAAGGAGVVTGQQGITDIVGSSAAGVEGGRPVAAFGTVGAVGAGAAGRRPGVGPGTYGGRDLPMQDQAIVGVGQTTGRRPTTLAANLGPLAPGGLGIELPGAPQTIGPHARVRDPLGEFTRSAIGIAGGIAQYGRQEGQLIGTGQPTTTFSPLAPGQLGTMGGTQQTPSPRRPLFGAQGTLAEYFGISSAQIFGGAGQTQPAAATTQAGRPATGRPATGRPGATREPPVITEAATLAHYTPERLAGIFTNIEAGGVPQTILPNSALVTHLQDQSIVDGYMNIYGYTRAGNNWVYTGGTGTAAGGAAAVAGQTAIVNGQEIQLAPVGDYYQDLFRRYGDILLNGNAGTQYSPSVTGRVDLYNVVNGALNWRVATG